jgi:hypothetical protein
MLEDGARSVQAVSEAVGYQDVAFFRAIFKRSTGMTPSEYRQSFAGMPRVTHGGSAAEERGRDNGSIVSQRCREDRSSVGSDAIAHAQCQFRRLA